MRRVIRAASLSDVVAFAGPLALYVASLVPGVAFWDTGEMQTVPTILGIAHPTGFPAFVLLGWMFAHALPVATPAWRISFFSACCAAGAAWLLYRFVRALTRDAWIALAAAWAYAAGDIVWTRATRAEVHDLALFFTMLAFVAAEGARRRPDGRCALLAAVACGCGLATHPVVALALPSVVVLAWPALRRLRLRQLAGLVACCSLPLALYLYVPLRSADVERRGLDSVDLGLRGAAFWNYDAPSTPARFVHYVGGGSFHPVTAFGAFATPAGAARAFGFARAAVTTEFGLVMAALALTGFAYLALEERRVAGAFTVLVAASATFVPNFRAESDALRYALPALWAGGACAGVGAWWLMLSIARERSGITSAFGAGILAIALWPNVVYAAHHVARQRTVDDARRFTADVERVTPDGALVIASWTYAAPLAYAAYVAHAFGRRRLVSGWPNDFVGRYGAWRRRFEHVYFVVPARFDAAPLATRVLGNDRWQIAELRR